MRKTQTHSYIRNLSSVFTFFLKDHTLVPNPLRWPTIGRTHFSYYEQRRGLRVRENYTFYKQPETGSPQKVASTFSEFYAQNCHEYFWYIRREKVEKCKNNTYLSDSCASEVASLLESQVAYKKMYRIWPQWDRIVQVKLIIPIARITSPIEPPMYFSSLSLKRRKVYTLFYEHRELHIWSHLAPRKH